MGMWRTLGWCLAGLLLLFPAVGHADDPPAVEATAAPVDHLYPFGLRTDGRPDRAPAPAKRRAAAVEDGLRWLAAHQSDDGLWTAADLSWCRGKSMHKDLEGPGKSLYDVGVSGIVLCAFLSAGYTHLDGSKHAETIARGLKAIAGQQDGEGCFGPRTSQHYLYNHAFGSLATVEALLLTDDARLLPIARKGLAFSALAQNPYFAWRYGVKPGDNDTSMTGCISVAFLAARRANEAALAAGLEPLLPYPREVLSGTRAWIDKMTDPDYGRTGYIRRGGAPARPQEKIDEFPGDRSESCTAIGLLLRLNTPSADENLDALLNRRAIKLLHGLPPTWSVGTGNIDLYYWYYGCLALTAAGEAAWQPWARAVETALLPNQRTDGDVCTYLGSWDAAGPWGPDGGRICSTALCIMMLQAPYRFPALPPDRSDLLEALARTDRPTPERIRLLGAVAALRVPGAQKPLTPWLEASEAGVRAAAARALAACDPDAGGVRALGKLLKEDASISVRLAAARGLGRVGGAATAALSSLQGGVTDADTRVRVAALNALRGLGRKAAKTAPAILPLLTHETPAVRVAAAGALQRIAPDTPDVEKVLLEGLGAAADAAVRRSAAAFLAGTEPKSPAVHAALTKALKDQDVRVRVEAARGVVDGAHDAKAVLAVLEGGLAAKDLDTRESALRLVAGMGPAAASVAPLVLAGALDGPVRIRSGSVGALEALGVGAQGAAAVLYACRKDPVMSVRQAAIAACQRLRSTPAPLVEALKGELGGKDPRVVDGAVAGLIECETAAVDPLRALLSTGESPAQARVLRILVAIGTAAKRALPEVLAVLDDTTSIDVQREAARALGALGAEDEAAVDRLTSLLDEKDWGVRRWALWSLGRLGAKQPKAVTVLGQLASNTDEAQRPIRLAALQALALTGQGATPILPSLMNAMGDENVHVREAAAKVVSGIGEPALDALLDAIRGVSAEYRNAALQAIEGMGEGAKKAIPDLAKLIEACQSWTSLEYAGALASIGKPAVRALKKLLRSKNLYARASAARALGQIGPDAKSAVSSLKRLLKDKNSAVRDEARKAISRIKKT